MNNKIWAISTNLNIWNVASYHINDLFMIQYNLKKRCSFCIPTYVGAIMVILMILTKFVLFQPLTADFSESPH